MPPYDPASTQAAFNNANAAITAQGGQAVSSAGTGFNTPNPPPSPTPQGSSPSVLSTTTTTDKKIPQLNAKLDSVSPTLTPSPDQNGNLNPTPFQQTHDMNNPANQAAYQATNAPSASSQNGQQYISDSNGGTVVNPNYDPGQNPQYLSAVSQLNQIQSQTDATSAAQIENIKQMFEQRKVQMQQIAGSQQNATQQTLLQGGGSRYSVGDQGIIPMMQTKTIQDLAGIDQQEQAAILSAQAAKNTSDYEMVQKKLALADKLYSQKQDILAKMSDQTLKDNQAFQAKQAQAQMSSDIASQFAQGTTQPADILAKLRASGDTTTTIKDITDSIAQMNPDQKAMRDILQSAAESGAPAQTLSAISSAKDFGGAISAAGIYLQKGTGDVGTWMADNKYLASIGKTPISLDEWMAKKNQMDLQQKTQAAYATAKASAQGKAAGTPAKPVGATVNGVPVGSVSAELQQMITDGKIDPNRLNSRTLPIYNDLAKASVNTVESHAGVAAKTKAYQDAVTYASLAKRTTSVLDKNMPLIYATADKVNSLGVPGLDKVLMGAKSYTGNNPDVIKYVNTLKTLRAEYANMLAKGTQVTDSVRNDAAEAIPAGLSADGYRALAGQLKLETQNIIDSANESAAGTFGNLSPVTQSIQKDQTHNGISLPGSEKSSGSTGSFQGITLPN